MLFERADYRPDVGPKLSTGGKMPFIGSNDGDRRERILTECGSRYGTGGLLGHSESGMARQLPQDDGPDA